MKEIRNLYSLFSELLDRNFGKLANQRDDAMFFNDCIPVCTRLKVTHRVFGLSVHERVNFT